MLRNSASDSSLGPGRRQWLTVLPMAALILVAAGCGTTDATSENATTAAVTTAAATESTTETATASAASYAITATAP